MDGGYGGGIQNRGNTCYVSAALQVLFRFRPFHELIQKLAEEFDGIDFFTSLAKMSENLEKAKDAILPDPIINLFALSPAKQFDVCEFMTLLLNRVVEISAQNSISSLFYFHFKEPDHPENVLFRSIPVSPGHSIGNALANIRESIDGKFTSLPNLLLIHIDRISYDSGTQTLEKDSSPMEIDEQLSFDDRTYHLYAIIQHLGKPDHGHYISFIRDASGWLKCNDSSVTATMVSEVLESSKSLCSPAYVLAYVADIEADIRVIRREAALRAFSSSESNLHLKLFDACCMRIVEEMDVQFDAIDEAITTIQEIRAGWQMKYGCRLRIRYKKNMDAMQDDFPRNITNLSQVDIVVWLERYDYSSIIPSMLNGVEKITVTYQIIPCDKLSIPVVFSGNDRVQKIVEYGKRIFQFMFKNQSLDVGVFVKMAEKYVRLDKDTDSDHSIFECRARIPNPSDNIIVGIRLHGPAPDNVMMFRATVWDTDTVLEEKDRIERQVEYDSTLDDMLRIAGRSFQRYVDLQLYSVDENGIMTRVDKKLSLVTIVTEYPNLRIERVPPPGSFNFILIDRDGKYVGMTCMLSIEHGESVEELEERVRRFFCMSESLCIRFRLQTGEEFRPRNPYDEVPRDVKMVVLVTPQ